MGDDDVATGVPSIGPRSEAWFALVAWLLSAGATLVALHPNGSENQRGALVLGGCCVLLEGALRVRARHLAWGSLAAILIAVGSFAVVPTIGKTSVFLALALLVAADAALLGWQPLPRWPARLTQIVWLALPTVLAASIAIRYRSPAEVPAVLILISLLIVEAYHRLPERMLRAEDTALRPVRASGLPRWWQGSRATTRTALRTARRSAAAWIRSPKDRRDRWFIAAVGVGFFLRLTWAFTMTRTPRGVSPIIGDWYSTWNLRMADQFANGHTPFILEKPTAFWAPGYAMLLSPVAWMRNTFSIISLEFGASLVNVVLGTGTILLVAAIAQRWLAPEARNPAAWLMAVAPSHIYLTSVAMPDALMTFLGVLVVWITTRTVDRSDVPRWRTMVLIGLLVGFAMLVSDRGSILLLVPALTIRASRSSWRGAARATGAVLIGAVLLLVPWTVRNGVQVGWWSPTATSTPEGLCTAKYDFSADQFAQTEDEVLLPVWRDCLAHGPLDDSSMSSSGFIPSGWTPQGPDEAKYARRNTRSSLAWFASHPAEVASRLPGRVRGVAGNDFNGGFELATHFNTIPLASPEMSLRYRSLANAWYQFTLALALLGFLRSRDLRRALPIWVIPAAIALGTVFGPYGFSRHFLAAQPFLVVMASAVFVAATPARGWRSRRRSEDAGVGSAALADDP